MELPKFERLKSRFLERNAGFSLNFNEVEGFFAGLSSLGFTCARDCVKAMCSSAIGNIVFDGEKESIRFLKTILSGCPVHKGFDFNNINLRKSSPAEFKWPLLDMAEFEFGAAATCDVSPINSQLENVIVLIGTPESSHKIGKSLKRLIHELLSRIDCTVENIHIPTNAVNGKLRTCIFIICHSPSEAQRACKSLDGFRFPIAGTANDLVSELSSPLPDVSFTIWQARMFRSYGREENDEGEESIKKGGSKSALALAATTEELGLHNNKKNTKNNVKSRRAKGFDATAPATATAATAAISEEITTYHQLHKSWSQGDERDSIKGLNTGIGVGVGLGLGTSSSPKISCNSSSVIATLMRFKISALDHYITSTSTNTTLKTATPLLENFLRVEEGLSSSLESSTDLKSLLTASVDYIKAIECVINEEDEEVGKWEGEDGDEQIDGQAVTLADLRNLLNRAIRSRNTTTSGEDSTRGLLMKIHSLVCSSQSIALTAHVGKEKKKSKTLQRVVDRLNDMVKEGEERLQYIKGLFTDSQREVEELEMRNRTLEESLTYHRIAADRLLALERQVDEAEMFRREAERRCIEAEQTIAEFQRSRHERSGSVSASISGSDVMGMGKDDFRSSSIASLSQKTVSDIMMMSNGDDNKLSEYELELETIISKIKLCRSQVAAKAAASSASTESSCCICLIAKCSVLLMPCRHLCVCDECGMREGLRQCPICRKSITSTISVYS